MILAFPRKNVVSVILLLILTFLFAARALSEETWLTDFEEICSLTQDASSMSPAELKNLVERCDRLRPIIESSDSPQKNVFLFRLDKCKKLFLYVLELDDK